ncbi:ATP-dependent RNA helicase RhlB [Alcanivorax sp. DG881]|jgi:ATP-dependent RNA helicase RhlB|uniref:ATP-dependent RNA helicase RhlB n=1 Tax=Alcanivorax sp. DG881 TaxID=236097 RepID=UPI00017ECB94|nr:ATP-dependent RNA helicase RhlB [Alcanivorax sp. DG881]EDX91203.1 DEAD/DEAH box helicase domain protein [Alcanivorax sp. DG881]
MQKDKASSWSLEQFQVPEKEGESRFHDFDLHLDLMHGIADSGFQYCTPIQAEVLTHTLAGADAIGRAQTGTGKTAAFLITVINDLLKHPIDVQRFAGEPRALIVAPTRELAMQIEKDAKVLAKHTDLQVMSVVGGMNFNRQQERLQNKLIDILVATPGRLLDFAKRRDLWLDRVEFLVLDEADRMLDMGFIPDVKRIVGMTPKSQYRQTQLFSATFNDDVMNLSRRWTQDAEVVEIEPTQVTTDTVEQKVYITNTDDKFKLLYNLITGMNMDKVIVFANRRDITRRVSDRLHKKGLKVSLISGDVPQTQRSKTLERFRAGDLQVLIATDVAGRGIHIDGVSHVVNYNLPEDPEDYVHRIGRTGRAGASGMSISFACEDDAFLLPELENAIGMKLECEYPPADLLAEKETAAPMKAPGHDTTQNAEKKD